MADIPFDQRDGFIWFNGELVPWKDAKIHVLTHGLHYGSCVFEGLRVYGGEIFKLRQHTALDTTPGRLANSAQQTSMGLFRGDHTGITAALLVISRALVFHRHECGQHR